LSAPAQQTSGLNDLLKDPVPGTRKEATWWA